MSANGLQVDRRTAMRWAGALAGLIGVAGQASVAGASPTKGYGTDPKLTGGVAAPWPRILTAGQLQAVAALVDHILPPEGETPGASGIGVHELIDEWVSAPYPDQLTDRALILAGLDDLDMRARSAGAGSFVAADPAVREALLTAWSSQPSAFHAKVRQLTIGGYYTTEIGFKDIGYTGNQALEAFPPVSDEVMRAIDGACVKLGLPAPS